MDSFEPKELIVLSISAVLPQQGQFYNDICRPVGHCQVWVGAAWKGDDHMTTTNVCGGGDAVCRYRYYSDLFIGNESAPL